SRAETLAVDGPAVLEATVGGLVEPLRELVGREVAALVHLPARPCDRQIHRVLIEFTVVATQPGAQIRFTARARTGCVLGFLRLALGLVREAETEISPHRAEQAGGT